MKKQLAEQVPLYSLRPYTVGGTLQVHALSKKIHVCLMVMEGRFSNKRSFFVVFEVD